MKNKILVLLILLISLGTILPSKAQELPDLKIISVYVQPETTFLGQPRTKIEIFYKNNGQATAKKFLIHVEVYKILTAPAKIDTVPCGLTASWDPWEEKIDGRCSSKILYWYGDPRNKIFICRLDPFNRIKEKNEINNNFKFSTKR